MSASSDNPIVIALTTLVDDEEAPAQELVRAARAEAPARPEASAAWQILDAAIGDLERGRRASALRGLIDAARALEALDDRLASLLAQVEAGRVELLLGQRRRGLARLRACAAAARAAHCEALALMAERAVELDLLHQIRTPDRAVLGSGSVSRARRSRALEAFHHVTSSADEALLEAGLDSAWREDEGPDYAVERLLILAGRAFLARRRGCADAVHERLQEAARFGMDASLDSELYLGVADRVRQAQLVVAGRREFITGELDLGDRFALVLDGSQQELRSSDRVISFRRKPVVRRLLYLLAAHQGQLVSKDALTRAVWGVDYNPLVHEYGLRVNIHHLRRAIEPVGLSVRFDDVGYRLEARCPFAFLETLASPVVR